MEEGKGEEEEEGAEEGKGVLFCTLLGAGIASRVQAPSNYQEHRMPLRCKISLLTECTIYPATHLAVGSSLAETSP